MTGAPNKARSFFIRAASMSSELLLLLLLRNDDEGAILGWCRSWSRMRQILPFKFLPSDDMTLKDKIRDGGQELRRKIRQKGEKNGRIDKKIVRVILMGENSPLG